MSENPSILDGAEPNRNPGYFLMQFLLLSGVVIPGAALIVELIWKICAEHLFDPIPTWWHVLLVAFVPVTNLQCYVAFLKGSTTRAIWLSFANGVAIFVALFYTIVFAPILPAALIAVVVLIGVLPLAPLMSLIAATVIRFKLRWISPENARGRPQWVAFGAAFLFTFVLIGIAELNYIVTRLGVEKANAADPKVQQEGLDLLRSYGDLDYMLRLSYDGPAVISSNLFVNLLRTGDIETVTERRTISEQARVAYYRVTGRQYRQDPMPTRVRRWSDFNDLDEIDPVTSARALKGLSLTTSDLDGSLDPDAALGYLQWTLVFRNENMTLQEAISEIQLPPGAVVSRLTLWINGEEREAAFGKTATVRQAYDTVTSTRRDPALVTLTGKDRIQLKCFPVPANGEMKVRLGITVPATLKSPETGQFNIPYFQSRNFSVATDHSVWIESKQGLAMDHPAMRHELGPGVFGIRGRVPEGDFNQLHIPVTFTRNSQSVTALARSRFDSTLEVRQELKEVPRHAASKLIVIVDPTSSMRASQEAIATALATLPRNFPTALILSGGNGLNLEIAAPNFSDSLATEAAAQVARARFEGGTDAVGAIEKAWELSTASPGSAIVWIHGPQMVELESPARLSQLWSRRPTEIPIYSFQIGLGENKIERSLNESNAVVTVPRTSDVSNDLRKMLRELVEGGSSFVAVRTATKTAGRRAVEVPSDVKSTSQHLVRLWANDETTRLLKAGENERAIQLAVENQLVTRVSGAVVLETQAQYEQFGLKPVDANTVPTIPEPHEYLLFGVFILVMIYLGWRLRRQTRLRAI